MTAPPSRKRPRRPRNVVARLNLAQMSVDAIAPLIVKDVLLRAAKARNNPRRCGERTSVRKRLRKSLERTPFPWLSQAEMAALVAQCLQLLEESVRIELLLQHRLTLSEVAALEGASEDELRTSLEDPAVRLFYAWPEYNPRTREISFSAARFDQRVRPHLVVPAIEPHPVLHPNWRNSPRRDIASP